MSTVRATLGSPLPNLQATTIGSTTHASDAQSLATAANSAALDNPAGRCMIDAPQNGETYTKAYTRWPNVAFSRIEWFFPGNTGYDFAFAASYSGSLALSITDGTNTIVATDPRIPYTFQGDLVTLPGDDTTSTVAGVLGGRGFIDWAAMYDVTRATFLTGADLRISIAVVVNNPGGFPSYLQRLQRFQLFDVPRFIVSEDVSDIGQGMAPADFLSSVDITDNPQYGIQRIQATCADARRLVQPTYISLEWPESTSADGVPFVTSGTDGPFHGVGGTLGLSLGGSSPMPFVVPPRQVAPATSTPGAPIVWRVLYRTTTGTTLKVHLHTSSGSSPFAATLADTAGAWVMAAWSNAYITTASPVETIYLTGALGTPGGGATGYLAGWWVQGAEP